MELAAKILIVGGLANLLYSFVTGNFLALARMKSPDASKYLVLAHMGPLMWAPILWGLVVVLPMSRLSETMEVIAASCMVGSSVLLGLKDTLYWRLGVKDEFAEKPVAFLLNVPLTILFALGLLIIAVGVIRGI